MVQMRRHRFARRYWTKITRAVRTNIEMVIAEA